ncbi:hypothetical protein ACFL13_01790 [Patescibacteria group bacterium]
MKYEILSRKDVFEEYRNHPRLKYLFGFRGEFSGRENINFLLRINNIKKKEIVRILRQLNFKAGPIPDAHYKSSISAVSNIDELVFPWLETLINLLPESLRPKIIIKRNPSKNRLHLRGHMVGHSVWLLTIHLEKNWMIPSLKRWYTEHYIKGLGDYDKGLVLLTNMLDSWE